MSVQLTLFDLGLYTVQPEPPPVNAPSAQKSERSEVQQLELPLFPQLMLFDLTHSLAA